MSSQSDQRKEYLIGKGVLHNTLCVCVQRGLVSYESRAVSLFWWTRVRSSDVKLKETRCPPSAGGKRMEIFPREGMRRLVSLY